VDFDGGIFQNGTDTTAGVTIGNGAGFAGLVSFQGTNTYGGPTIISNGTLQLTGNLVLTNTTPINIGTGTTFDVSSLTGYTLGAVKPQTLLGTGTFKGNLTTQAGSTLAPGSPVGALTVNGNATLGGLTAMSLNRTNTPVNSSKLSVTGTLTAGGTLTVTNVGPPLQVNDTFQLFSQPVSGFTSVTIATNDANKYVYSFQNNLSTQGSIKVVSATAPVNTNPATANFKAVSAAGQLQFSWAPDHMGWQLYTNSVSLTATNSWFPVAGSAGVTNENININPALPAVFFQLRYP